MIDTRNDTADALALALSALNRLPESERRRLILGEWAPEAAPARRGEKGYKMATYFGPKSSIGSFTGSGRMIADGIPYRAETKDSTALTLPEWKHFALAVCNAPDDDLARLVAADWLEEHGDWEYAGLIRKQCEFHNQPSQECAEQIWALWRGSEYPSKIRPVCILMRNVMRMAHRDVFVLENTFHSTRPIDNRVRRGFIEVLIADSALLHTTLWNLFLNLPIRHVITTDIQPRVSGSGNGEWFWHLNSINGKCGDHVIGVHFFHLLRYGRYETAHTTGRLFRSYPCRALALYDLSLAIIDHFRDVAKLAPWPRATVGTCPRNSAARKRGRKLKKDQDYYAAPQEADTLYEHFLGHLEAFDRRRT